MVFIHDTRDQAGKHDVLESYLVANGHKIVRSKMYVGDISLLHDQSVCIDLKGIGLQEVYSNLVQSHDRFRAECIRAQEAGIQLIVLVEENGIADLAGVEEWENPRIEQYEYLKAAHEHGKLLNKKLPRTPPISSKRLMVMMETMTKRYGVRWEFCNKKDVGQKVVELLGGAS